MARKRRAELRPRNGHTLVVGIVARISGGPNQKELSLDDQIDHGKQVVADEAGDFAGPTRYIEIATTAKGERLDRPELRQIEDLLRRRELDVLVCEDIGRLIRGGEAVRLCGVAVDHGTRVIAPHDRIDTAEEGWEQDVLDACAEHVGHNVHVSKRLKFKLMNRFLKSGEATARPIYGYVVPAGAKSYGDWLLDPAATPIYREWARRMRDDPNGEAVADWLNAKGVPVGRYSRGPKWTGKMVRRVIRNPLLKGMPYRGAKVTVKQYETGRWVSVPNPDGPAYKAFPHLAHVPPAEWDELYAILKAAAQKYRRKAVDGRDPRAGVARKRTAFPGQHARCGVCGRLYYWGGHGQKAHMMCAGSRDYLCWNGATFDGEVGGRRIAEAVLAAVEALPGYDAEFERRVRENAAAGRDRRAAAAAGLKAEEGTLERAVENLLDQMEGPKTSPALARRLAEREAQLAEVTRQLDAVRAAGEETPALPSFEALQARARERLGTTVMDRPEFGRAMRDVVPEILIFPFRDVDSGRVVARARVTIDLVSLLPDALAGDAAGVLRTTIWVDLFDPPRRIALLGKIVALRAAGRTERQVAEALGVHQPTVQRAMKLVRKMEVAGVTDPYQLLTGPPDADGRLKRHRRERFTFTPLDGFPRWPSDR
jgi:site-specific DNA recombinase